MLLLFTEDAALQILVHLGEQCTGVSISCAFLKYLDTFFVFPLSNRYDSLVKMSYMISASFLVHVRSIWVHKQQHFSRLTHNIMGYRSVTKKVLRRT